MNRAGIAAWARREGIPQRHSDAFPEPYRTITRRRVRDDAAVFAERPRLQWFDRPMERGEVGPGVDLPLTTWVRVLRVDGETHARVFYPEGRPS